MEYKLCKDNVICCSDDCKRCANRAYEALTNANNDLKKTNKECLDKIEELEKTINYLREEYDILVVKNIDLIYRNGLLTKTTGPVISQHAYGDLNDKIEGLKEDITRLDKCLSRCPCVKEELL